MSQTHIDGVQELSLITVWLKFQVFVGLLSHGNINLKAKMNETNFFRWNSISKNY